MRMPFVSRRAFDLVCADRDRALTMVGEERARLAQLQDQVVRIARREMGMSEEPRQPRPKEEPMPQDLVRYFRGLHPPSLGKAQRDEARKRHRDGLPWDEIRALVFDEDEPEGDEFPEAVT